MQHTDAIDDSNELEFPREMEGSFEEENSDDRLKRFAKERLENIEHILALISRLLENPISLSRREEYQKKREKYLRRMEEERARQHNLEVRDPNRCTADGNRFSPLLLGIVLLWKVVTRPSKQKE